MFERGKVTRQAHVDIPEGLFEEEYGREGFFGPYAHLYRTHAPVGWTRVEGNHRPRAYRLADTPLGDDYWKCRVPFLANADTTLSFGGLIEPMPYHFRNADGDEVLFIHRGGGIIETDFGPLAYEGGDYLVIPRGTVYRLRPSAETRLLVIQTRGAVTVPDRGLLGQHALFDPSVLDVPTPTPNPDEGDRKEWELRIQRCGEITSYFYPHNPIDVVGWKGNLSVTKLNIRDIRPIASERYHLPPTSHCTFMADNVVIVSFLPRPLETGDPGAMKVPYFHSNIDYDEVIFYHDGDFFSRSGLSAGMMTFHPQGVHHGPHPKAIERSRNATRTEEKAIMVDTRNPLFPTEQAADFEMQNYWRSWMDDTDNPATPSTSPSTSQAEEEVLG